MKAKCFLVVILAVLAANGLLFAVAVSDAVSPVHGIVLGMVILGGYSVVCALIADKAAERREKDEEDMEI